MKWIVLTGAVLFNLHALDLKDQIQGLLFDLIKEKMVLWKQMRCLEVTAAIVTETLMEIGVNILLSPEEIHWPTGEVTKPGPGPKKKKGGKKAEKNKHGIYSQLVTELSPTLPVVNSEAVSPKKKQPVSMKAKVTKKQQAVDTSDVDVDEDPEKTGHVGLPVQGRRCKSEICLSQSNFPSFIAISCTLINKLIL